MPPSPRPPRPRSGFARRIRALACRYWALSPDEYDRRAAERLITLPDVADLLWMLVHDPLTAVWIMQYLSPKAVAAAKVRDREARDHNQAMTFLRMVQPKSDEDRAYLEALFAQEEGR